MADDFPEDSFFRNSNVAVLEAALQNTTESNNEHLINKIDDVTSAFKTSTCSPVISSITGEISSSLKATKSSKSVCYGKSKDSVKSTQKTSKKFVKRVVASGADVNDNGGSNCENSDVQSKDKSKNSYRPLNITKNVVVSTKGSLPSSSDVPQVAGSSVLLNSINGLDGTGSSSDSYLVSTQQKLKLETWGLPQTILKQYAKRGITEMFPWQVECLCRPRVLSGGNLVYSAPTSAGKTLVSEIICIKTVIERHKKVLFVLPFVSVVREKMIYFQDIFRGSRVRVDGFMGGHSAPGGFLSLDIAVCTIEKANSLINRLMEENELTKLGAVVVDELHLVGDPHRGYLLELLLTKLKYMSLRSDQISIQLVGMSATLPNLSLLSSWLDADLYSTSFRPVPLEEFIKIGNTILDNSLKPVRTISPQLEIKNDTEDIVYLCLETIANGHSVLIFCPTKSWCESLALTVATEFRTIGLHRDINAPDSLAYKLREQLNPDQIADCLQLLRSSPVGLDNSLRKVVSFGVAYHHAGLSMDERDILEGCFKNTTLRVLIATTTLSSGVNLPARRVIIRSPVFQGRSIDILSYRQMVGRAGRMGVDSAGESIIICQNTERHIVANLVCASLKPIESCLGLGDLSASLKRAVLEVIASKVASNPEDLKIYTNCTLLASSQKSKENVCNPVFSCIKFLQQNELIRLQTDDSGVLHYTPTPLGLACLSASIHPDEGLRLFQELQRARQCFVLENELHLVYQVTPFNVADQWGNLDWLHVLSLWEQLPKDMRRVGELVGVEDRFIVRAMRGTINIKLEKQREKLLIHRRFYTALALHDLVNEVPLNTVASKFNCSRGLLQSLQQSAATYAGMVTSFCRRLGWSSVELLIEQFQDRLHFGTHRELLDLLKLPSLNGPRARALYNVGVTSVTELTTADILLVENALHSTIPFLSDKERDGDTTSDSERRRKLKGIWITGKHGLSEREAAELLIKEARAIIQAELGLVVVNWDQNNHESSTSSTTINSVQEKSPVMFDLHNSGAVVLKKALCDESMNKKLVATEETQIEILETITSALPLHDISDRPVSSDLAKKVPDPSFKANMDVKPITVMRSKEICEGIVDNVDNLLDLETATANITRNVQKVQNGNEKLKVESTGNPDSPMNSSTNTSCILDHNICDVSSLSETSENNDFLTGCRVVTTKATNSDVRNKSSVDSMEDLFESPFSNTALAKLDEQCIEVLREDSQAFKRADLSPSSTSASFLCKDSLSCLESWGITNSVLEKLCAHEVSGKCEVDKSAQEQKATENTSIRRLSADIFAQSQSENICNTPMLQNEDLKDSDDLFGSFLSPKSGETAQQRDKSRTKKRSFELNNPILQVSENALGDGLRSSSLFGDSFEINTGLIEALDGCKSSKLESSEAEEAFVLNGKKLQHLGSDFNRTCKKVCASESANPSVSLNSNQCKSIPRDLGFEKTSLKALGKKRGSREYGKSLRQPGEITLNRKSGNLYLGLSRRGPLKKNKKVEVVNLSVKDEDSKVDVLSDSFLEAAFETAFRGTQETPVLLSSDLPNVNFKAGISNAFDQECINSSSNRKRLEESTLSSDEDVISSPQDCVVASGVRKSPITPRILSRSNEVRRQNSQGLAFNVKCTIGPYYTRQVCQNNVNESRKQLEENKKFPNGSPPLEDLSPKSPFQSSFVEDWSSFNVIDVSRNETLFKTFAKEILNSNTWSFSFACERNQSNEPTVTIGSKILKLEKSLKQKSASLSFSQLAFGEITLIGVAFCFGGTDAYFLSLETETEQCVVNLSDRVQLLQNIMCRSGSGPHPTVCCFNVKDVFKVIVRCMGIQISHISVFDPKVGDWLLDPEGKEKTFPAMVLKYAAQAVVLADHAGHVKHGLGSPALDIDQILPGRQRCSVEAIVCYEIMSSQFELLREANLLRSFVDVEMPVVLSVARLELAGIGFCAETLQILQEKICQEMSSLEKKAYLLAGRSFCLTSPTDTARVLYQELKLGQGMSMKGRPKNTSKDTLNKLRSEHPLPDIILLWRKLNAINSKTICPLLPSDPCSRLFGSYILHTATGRISMYEPNIQCIPRDFKLSETEELFSMRSSFVAPEGYLLVSADYSQLELRLLAHLSGDLKLRKILNANEDVFQNLSAVWNDIPCEEVTDDLRQKTKQLCYGIVYGMGAQALADQLEVDTSEASALKDTFHDRFPGIAEFLTKTVEQCHEEGFVTTLLGRRRYLPGIKSSNFHVKAHSERQAVNTTVQGSAADLSKTAMIAVEKRLNLLFPRPLSFKENESSSKFPRLVLHLHDELIYEVPIHFVDEFCSILKHEMENAINVTVKLPVKVKVGKTWGSLIVRNVD